MKIYLICVEDGSLRPHARIKRQKGISLDKNKAELYLSTLKEKNYEDRINYVRNRGFVDYFRSTTCYDDSEHEFIETISSEFEKAKKIADELEDYYNNTYFGIGVCETIFSIEEMEVEEIDY